MVLDFSALGMNFLLGCGAGKAGSATDPPGRESRDAFTEHPANVPSLNELSRLSSSSRDYHYLAGLLHDLGKFKPDLQHPRELRGFSTASGLDETGAFWPIIHTLSVEQLEALAQSGALDLTRVMADASVALEKAALAAETIVTTSKVMRNSLAEG